MKKTFALGLVTIVGLSLAGCSTADSDTEESSAAATSSSAESTSDDSSQSGYTYATAAFGEEYVWDSGLAVTISAPTETTFSDSALETYGADDTTIPVYSSVTITNGTDEEIDTSTFFYGLVAGATYGTEVDDSDNEIGYISGTLSPGQTETYNIGFLTTDLDDAYIYWSDLSGDNTEVYFIG